MNININSGLSEHQLISLRKIELDAQHQTKEELIAALIYVSRLLLLEQNLTNSNTDFNDRKIMNGYNQRDKNLVNIAKIILQEQGVKPYMPDNFIMDSKDSKITSALKVADQIIKYLDK